MLQKERILYLFLIWLCLALYFFNNLLLKQISAGFLWYFSVSHLNDFLAPVIMLSVSNFFLSLTGRSILRLWQVLLFTFACGSFWEFTAFFFPDGVLILPASTFDPLDFVAYFLGGFVFWIIVKRVNPAEKN